MFEAIRDALIWIMSWIVDRRLHSEEAARLLALAAVSVLATWLIIYWKTFAGRSAAIRRRLMPEERYAGRYLQALWRPGEVRYSIIDLFYNARRRRYEVAGRTYNSEGKELAAFQSSYVLFPSSKHAHIEFIWQASNGTSGYTKMTLEDLKDDYIQGDGLVITFDAWPKAYPIRFKHLADHYVRDALGVRSPSNTAEEPDFIKTFHATYGERVMEGFGGNGKKKEAPAAETVLETQS